MTPLVKQSFDRLRGVYQALATDKAGLEEHLAADLAHRACIVARACVLRSAPVAAAEAVFEYRTVMARRKTHEVQQALLAKADELLDSQTPWQVQDQDILLQSYFKDLPRPFVVRLQRAGDASLRRFACECASTTLEAARNELTGSGQPADFAGLLAVMET